MKKETVTPTASEKMSTRQKCRRRVQRSSSFYIDATEDEKNAQSQNDLCNEKANS